MKKFVLIFIISLTFLNSYSQSEENFKPYFKPLVLFFTNVNTSINETGRSTAFELTRAYLGFEYYFSENLSTRINTDIADPGAGNLQMTAYIKNAWLQYKKDGFTARIGMVGLMQFDLPERQWGYRYIYKSFQDEYGFGPSADLGMTLEYSPVKEITFDFAVVNGEGFKKLQSDSTFRAAMGITIRPVEGLELRGYFDRMKKNYVQKTASFFAGYTINKFKAGAEYNLQKNHGMLNNRDYSGISVYTSLGLPKNFSVFARYDYLMSESPSETEAPWNIRNDGEAFIAGFDFSPVKGVKIGPSYIGWKPSDESLPFTSNLALNFEIRF